MAYFDCIVGGSSGKWKLTVTCTNVFAGLTITCTDGTTTLTKTCPSSSPYTVVFNIPNGGTWTISGVYGGKTNTTTVVIPDTATLNYIPTGSTATPTNDIQTWLHCANIWNKSYTTINQVLADTSTLLALISSNNAADYMARSTNWASSVCANQTAMGYIGNNDYCANKLLDNATWLNAICNSTYFESVLNVKVPTMTSNTAPRGTAFASQYQSDGEAYRAFDNDVSTRWIAYVSGTLSGKNQYDGYTFTSAVDVRKVMINPYYDGFLRVKNFKIQGSNDGFASDIHDLYTGIFSNNSSSESAPHYFIFQNNNNYSSYRVFVIDHYGNTELAIGIKEIQFYGR